jgi:hypothetical protein
MPVSGSRRGAKGVAGDVEPGHRSRIIDVEIVPDTCHDRGRVVNQRIENDRSLRTIGDFSELLLATVLQGIKHIDFASSIQRMQFFRTALS